MRGRRHEAGFALEDLTGILLRTTVTKTRRERHHKWVLYRFRSFIEYKAGRAGVLVKVIGGVYTSRQCSVPLPRHWGRGEIASL